MIGFLLLPNITTDPRCSPTGQNDALLTIPLLVFLQNISMSCQILQRNNRTNSSVYETLDHTQKKHSVTECGKKETTSVATLAHRQKKLPEFAKNNRINFGTETIPGKKNTCKMCKKQKKQQ